MDRLMLLVLSFMVIGCFDSNGVVLETANCSSYRDVSVNSVVVDDKHDLLSDSSLRHVISTAFRNACISFSDMSVDGGKVSTHPNSSPYKLRLDVSLTSSENNDRGFIVDESDRVVFIEVTSRLNRDRTNVESKQSTKLKENSKKIADIGPKNYFSKEDIENATINTIASSLRNVFNAMDR